MSTPLGASFKVLLSEHPSVGYVGAATSFLGALPAWVLDVRDAMGILSIAVGLAVGLLTFRLQLAAVRERRAQIAELERMRGMRTARHDEPDAQGS